MAGDANLHSDAHYEADGCGNRQYEVEQSLFTDSLDELKPDDIGNPVSEKADFREIMPSVIKYGIMLVCAVAFCISGTYIVKSLAEYNRMQRVNDQIASDFRSSSWAMSMLRQSVETPDYEKSQNLSQDDINKLIDKNLSDEEVYAKYREKLSLYKLTYPRVFGWVQIDGTNIDYIVMQSGDNEFYLNHDYTGSYSAGGSIFADYRCSRNVNENRNLILYGHHMTNSTMFHMLDNFQNKKFFEEHQYILLHTENGTYKYQIFAAYQTTADYKYIQTYFTTDAEYTAFLEEMQSNSIWKRDDIKLTSESRIITLSTCTNTVADGRIAVQAVLVETFGDK